ncbi:hypothetical protein [Streptomyces sp. ISID311]|uniref:hypothetical protein n=1 Tax=Streptomyces sp. ISID311 TaxID=2601673 RepID=UPI0011BD4270|nr:hypothetical protein [Streptomyces sp. ISID311]TXC98898.1 hypothetical protein FS847_05785 [Streptomyces sp. ISID311]
MRGWAPGGGPVGPVEATSDSVQRGDVIQIGGRPCRVTDLLQLPDGAKRLWFESGELLTMHSRTRLVAVRMLSRW